LSHGIPFSKEVGLGFETPEIIMKEEEGERRGGGW
jgi:hypothetical protein